MSAEYFDPTALQAATATHHVTYQKDDRITICCNICNIILVAVGFEHFVFHENQSMAVG